MSLSTTRSINMARSILARTAVGSVLVLGMAGFAASAQAAQTISNLVSNGDSIVLTDPYASGRSTPLYLQSSNASVHFSNGDANPNSLGAAVGVFNVLQLNATVANGATLSETADVDTFGDSIRVTSQVGAPLNGLTVVTYDTVNPSNVGVFGSVDLTGSLNWQAPRQNGVATGGSMSISNMRVDLMNGLVLADLSGQKNAVGLKNYAAMSLSDAVVWTFGASDISGPTSISPNSLFSADPIAALAADGFTNFTLIGSFGDGFDANIVISHLQLTNTASNFMTDSFGLLTTGNNAKDAVNGEEGGWGTLVLNASFTNVPEPSTYALMGLGLAGVVFASRRKRAALA